tara:strand:+ start:1324 stop:1641 length:318 start_codon:yes stop_codon:yes gene_type:complete
MPDNKKAKRAGKKVIRKIKRGKDVQSQSSKDVMSKVVRRTQDPVKSGSAGSGKITKTTDAAKVRGAYSKVTSTRVKKKIQTAKKASKKAVDSLMGYSKGGLIQHD